APSPPAAPGAPAAVPADCPTGGVGPAFGPLLPSGFLLFVARRYSAAPVCHPLLSRSRAAPAVRSGARWVQQARLPPLFEPVALAADVHRGGVVQQPVEDRRRQDRIPKDAAPLPVALVAG